jgi:hypothetical protein
MIVFRAVSSSFKKNALIPVIGRIQVHLYTHRIETIHLVAAIHDVETSRANCPLPELPYISKATVSGVMEWCRGIQTIEKPRLVGV